MQSVELRLNLVVAKNPQLINSLDGNKNYPLIRTETHGTFRFTCHQVQFVSFCCIGIVFGIPASQILWTLSEIVLHFSDKGNFQ